MRLITGLTTVAFVVLALAGCTTTAGDNTTYARPEASSSFQMPLD
ncbi:hypothetical protein [Shinella daejeonensis]|nr:hypothetical protein [Shinella daejeonensis]